MSQLRHVSETPVARRGVQQERSSRVFSFEHGHVLYTNIVETEDIDKRDTPLQVNNYFCCQENETLTKITEIYLEDKLIRIKDEFILINDLKQLKIDRERADKFVTRRNYYNDSDRQEKNDTKNLIKNIINLFIGWLRKRKTREGLAMSRRAKNIIKQKKYYNRMLIQELCKDIEICRCFIQFSEEDAQQAIQNSRINDKACHVKAIRNYAKLFVESRKKLEKQIDKSVTVSTSI